MSLATRDGLEIAPQTGRLLGPEGGQRTKRAKRGKAGESIWLATKGAWESYGVPRKASEKLPVNQGAKGLTQVILPVTSQGLSE